MKDTNLLSKIRTKQARIAVIGLGYVGLPLAVEKAKVGFTVIGIERKQERVDKVNRGENYIPDVLDIELAEVITNGGLQATQSFDVIADVDIITICVPTPLDKNKNPDTSYIEYVVDQSLPYLKKGQLMVLESTTYPGTTEEVILPRIQSRGFTVGEDFFLAFSPERVDPGNKKYKLKDIPKVVGGVTQRCTEAAKALYETVLKSPVFTVSSPRAAEMTKLLENVFRVVNVSLVNELAILCDRMGIDIWEVIEAAKTKPFGFMPFYPGPGMGGHCLRGAEHVVIKEEGQMKAVPLQELFAQFQAGNQDGLLFLNNGLEALTWEPYEGRSVWRRVRILSRRRYQGPLLRIKTHLGRTLTVTEEHPMLVRGSDGWEVKPANQIRVGDELPFVAGYPKESTQQKIDLIDELQRAKHTALFHDARVKPVGGSFRQFKGILYRELRKLGIPFDVKQEYVRQNYSPLALYSQLEDKLSLSREALRLYTGRGKITLIPALIDLDQDFLRLLGYYVAEGCLTRDESDRVRFTFHRREVELLEDVTSILDRLGIKYSIYDDAQWQARHIKVSSRVFGWLLSDVLGCGHDSHSARIPRFVFDLDASLIRAFLSGLFRGDGWVEVQDHSTMIGFGTCNAALAEEVCLLLQTLGVVAARKVQNTKNQTKPLQIIKIFGADQVLKLLDLPASEKRTKLEHALNQRAKEIHRYQFQQAEGHFTLKVAGIEEERNADEPVYSMEVEETHTFTTSGGMIVHNCIPIDPFYLVWKAKEYGFATRFIELAGEINDNMPEYIVHRVAEILNEKKKALNGARVLLVGVAYKRDVDDIRESPALKIAHLLLQRGAIVSYHDPYIPKVVLYGKEFLSVPLTTEALQKSDLVIITTDHSNIDYKLIVEHAALIYDTRNALARYRGQHIHRLGAKRGEHRQMGDHND